MHKDAFYFFHDSNARDDPKCSALIEKHGCEGYGIFWILVEILREQPEYKYPLSLIGSIARKYNTNTEIVRSVLTEFNLFETDNEHFFTLALIRRMEPLKRKREQAAEAGRMSAKARQDKGLKTDVQRPFNDQSNDRSTPVRTDVELKEEKRREKKREEKKRVEEKKVDEKRVEELLASLSASLRDAMEDFISHRIAIKAPMTPRAIKLLLTELGKLTDDDEAKVAILNQSVINGWKGVFAIRDQMVNSKGQHMTEQERILAL